MLLCLDEKNEHFLRRHSLAGLNLSNNEWKHGMKAIGAFVVERWRNANEELNLKSMAVEMLNFVPNCV